MNSEVKAALKKELQSLLAEAGLPKESELIGRKFAFTYITAKNREPGVGDVVRVTGTILGIHICNRLKNFALVTTPLPQRRTSHTFEPAINFYGGGSNYSGSWRISFLREDINEVENFNGEFELLF